MMNHFAEQLGMRDTHFMNATGLPHPEHYTTARDVAILSVATIRDFPDFYAWYAEKEFTFNGIRQHNRNTLLWRDPAIDGLKTGHTESAGSLPGRLGHARRHAADQRGDGSASEASRASETQTLLNYGRLKRSSCTRPGRNWRRPKSGKARSRKFRWAPAMRCS
jgi:D-alanyl-D-alanine carboxypeptidase (penicillin-binding protein 5/6)